MATHGSGSGHKPLSGPELESLFSKVYRSGMWWQFPKLVLALELKNSNDVLLLSFLMDHHRMLWQSPQQRRRMLNGDRFFCRNTQILDVFVWWSPKMLYDSLNRLEERGLIQRDKEAAGRGRYIRIRYENMVAQLRKRLKKRSTKTFSAQDRVFDGEQWVQRNSGNQKYGKRLGENWMELDLSDGEKDRKRRSRFGGVDL